MNQRIERHGFSRIHNIPSSWAARNKSTVKRQRVLASASCLCSSGVPPSMMDWSPQGSLSDRSGRASGKPASRSACGMGSSRARDPVSHGVATSNATTGGSPRSRRITCARPAAVRMSARLTGTSARTRAPFQSNGSMPKPRSRHWREKPAVPANCSITTPGANCTRRGDRTAPAEPLGLGQRSAGRRAGACPCWATLLASAAAAPVGTGAAGAAEPPAEISRARWPGLLDPRPRRREGPTRAPARPGWPGLRTPPPGSSPGGGPARAGHRPTLLGGLGLRRAPD